MLISLPFLFLAGGPVVIDIETYISSVSSIDEKDMVSKIFPKIVKGKMKGFSCPFSFSF